MMSECLTSLVGLDGCTEGTEPFKLNAIGYSVSQLEELMDDSYANIDDFFHACRGTAAQMLASDFLTHIPMSAKGSSGLESRNVGFEQERRQLVTQSGIRGIRTHFRNSSDYLIFRITNIKMYLAYTGQVELKVWNLNTGEEIATATVEGEHGKVVSNAVNIAIPSRRQDVRFFIGYETAGDAYAISNERNSCAGCGGGYNRTSGYITTSGASITAPFLSQDVTRNNDLAGIMMDYTIECDNDRLLCDYKGLLGQAMLWKTAMVVLEYGAKSGGQFSEQKVMNSENNDVRYERAEFNYTDKLKVALKHLRLPIGRCFYCNTVTEIVTRLPG